MKKLTIILVALAAVFVACKKSSPADEVVKAFDNMLEKVKQAKTLDDIQALAPEAEKIADDLEAKYPDWEPTAEEEKTITEAMENYEKEVMAVTAKLLPDFASDEIGKALDEVNDEIDKELSTEEEAPAEK